MTVMRREVMTILPGKMGEVPKLLQRHTAAATRLNVPGGTRAYRCFAGGGDFFHTFIFEQEWDSLSALEAHGDKMRSDPEMREILAGWAKIIDSHEIELYTLME